jgi:hypothetical protein
MNDNDTLIELHFSISGDCELTFSTYCSSPVCHILWLSKFCALVGVVSMMVGGHGGETSYSVEEKKRSTGLGNRAGQGRVG